jgi:CheY-like chemotaxis protein
MPKILIVEDNEENRDALARRLRRRGYDIALACNGQEGVDATRSQAPDLVLMDMNMPILDGWQASRKIKADPATAALPIIALTAHALAGDRDKALQAGCMDYHTKPIDFPRLMAQIERALQEAASRER